MLDIDKLTSTLVGQTVKAIDKATAPLVSRIEELEKAVSETPAPVEVDRDSIVQTAVDAVKGDLDEVREAVASIPEPEPVELPDIAAMVDDAVKSAVAEIPTPKDGDSVTLDDVLPELKAHLAELVEVLPKAEKGADGVGLAGAFIDRDGVLTVTLTNGETRGLGPIVGKDGEPGIGFDDLDIVHDGERGFTFRFQRGAKLIERSFNLPVMLDRGVFTDGKEYAAGDVVSYGGSMWIAQKETVEKPGTGDGWRLSVKKGRDGKDGEIKAAPEPKTVKVG